MLKRHKEFFIFAGFIVILLSFVYFLFGCRETTEPNDPNDYMLTWKEDDWNDVLLTAYPHPVENAYLLYLNIDIRDINDLDAYWGSIEATHKAQVHIEINGEAKEFTLEQFKLRLGFFDAEYGTDITLYPKSDFDKFLDALAWAESENDPNAVGDEGRAVGLYQIHQIYVIDVNRILGKDIYTIHDRLDPIKSRDMTIIYIQHYAGVKAGPEKRDKMQLWEKMARIHNAGPDGWRNDPHWFVRNRGYTLEQAKKKIANTKAYWERVKKGYESTGTKL